MTVDYFKNYKTLCDNTLHKTYHSSFNVGLGRSFLRREINLSLSDVSGVPKNTSTKTTVLDFIKADKETQDSFISMDIRYDVMNIMTKFPWREIYGLSYQDTMRLDYSTWIMLRKNIIDGETQSLVVEKDRIIEDRHKVIHSTLQRLCALFEALFMSNPNDNGVPLKPTTNNRQTHTTKRKK